MTLVRLLNLTLILTLLTLVRLLNLTLTLTLLTLVRLLNQTLTLTLLTLVRLLNLTLTLEQRRSKKFKSNHNPEKAVSNTGQIGQAERRTITSACFAFCQFLETSLRPVKF